MQRRYALVPVGLLVLAFGFVSSASATQPPARLAESLTPETSPNAGIGTMLERAPAIGLLPGDDLVREQAGVRSLAPAAACRRIAQAVEHPPIEDDALLDLGHLVERCRAWLASGGADSPSRVSVCRRIAQAEPEVLAPLVERCRRILEDRPHPERPYAQDLTSQRGSLV